MLWIMEFWATISTKATFKNTGFHYPFVDSAFFVLDFFTHNISRTVKSKAY